MTMDARNAPGEDGDDFGDPSASSSGRPVDWEPPIPDSVDLVVEAAGLVSVFTAQQYLRIDAMRCEQLEDARRHGFELNDVIERSIRLELAAALSITESAAGSLIAQADALVNRFPAAFDSLAHARITPRHASDLVEVMNGVEIEFHDALLPKVIALAEANPVGTFRRLLRQLVETVRATTLSERHEKALELRRVTMRPAEDGMGELTLFGPMVEINAGYGRLTALAKAIKKRPGEERTLDQIRADSFGDLLIDGDTDLIPAEARGIHARVVVTVPALALLDADSANGAIATVEGIGPIPFERARELCGGAKTWMRVLTHPETGIVLSVGRDQYSPPADLRRLVQWRAETCMAPGCNVPASRCEVDHNVAWQDGGETRLENLCPFCKGHHTVKHHGRWCVAQTEGSGGAVMWTSPTGRRYRVEPTRRVPVFTPTEDQSLPPF